MSTAPRGPGPGRDAYTALRDQTITHVHGEQFGVAGAMSITPPQLEYPVRGREELMASLLAAPPGSAQVLCGAGGYGKTTVALAVAEHARSQGMDGWRVSAADAASLSAGMRALAARLGATPERLRLAWSGHDGDAPDLVWELLASHGRPWLLVVDNADDTRLLTAAGDRVADGTGWIRRPPPAGRLVVTSRNHDSSTWGGWVQLHPLQDLSAEHAAQVLHDRAGDCAGTLDQAAALAGRLGHMPLMLHQAGLYLAHVRRGAPWPGTRRNPRTFDEYRTALDHRFGELVDGPIRDSPARQPRLRVTATWELTLDLLAEQGITLARPLMRLLSHFADAPIPYAMILSPQSLAASPLFTLRNENDLDQAIDALADFGLLTKRTPDTAIDDPAAYTATLHPAIAETIRAHDEVRAQRHDYLALAAAGLRDAVRDHDPRNPTSWPLWQLTASHLNRLCALATSTGDHVPPPLADALTTTAAACTEYAITAGLYTQADVILTQAADAAATLRPDQPAVLQLRHQCARLEEHQGNLTAAEAGYRAVLTERTRVLGADHPNTLDTRYGLAGVLAQRGDLGGAEAGYRAVLTEQTRVLGADHPNTLWTRYGLAWVLAQRGDLGGAEAGYRAVLTERTRVLGADHPDTLATKDALAALAVRR
ncbi:MAG: tetratricopeptide repeat protein [Pseudonocardiaceae bacterium]